MSFDITKPSPPPPNRDCRLDNGMFETKESKERLAKYERDLNEWAWRQANPTKNPHEYTRAEEGYDRGINKEAVSPEKPKEPEIIKCPYSPNVKCLIGDGCCEECSRKRRAAGRVLVDKIITNKNGGRHSAIETAMTLLPGRAVMEIGRMMKIGADVYGRDDNWSKLTFAELMDHALEHWFKFQNGEGVPRDELASFLTRAAMAVDKWNENREQIEVLESEDSK